MSRPAQLDAAFPVGVVNHDEEVGDGSGHGAAMVGFDSGQQVERGSISVERRADCGG
jgi:hypothetical protein